MTSDFYSLFNKPDPTPRADPATVTPLDPARATRYAARALEAEVQAVATAAEGTRNHTLNRAAFNVGQLVAAGHLDHDDAHHTLHQAARAAGLDDTEIHATLASGLRAGAQTPRVVPDLPDTPIPATTVLEAAKEAADQAPDAVETLLPIIDWHQLFAAEDDGEEWIVDPLLPARRIIALYSAPKVGKSLLMLEVAAAIARGTPVLGTQTKQRRVLYVDFENDPRGDIRTRLEAMDLTADNLTDLCYLSYPTLAKLDTPQGAVELLAAAKHYQCDVVVIDTVSRAVGGEENDNDTWLAFYRHTGLAMKQAGIACIRLDHSGKDADKGMRGGSAKYGDVDAVWRLTALGETTLLLECTDHRMPVETDRLTLLRNTWPLRHDLSGDPRATAMDAKEKTISDDLDSLDVPHDASGNECHKRLREAGRGANRQLVLRVAKIRQMRLPTPSTGGSGTTLEPPGTTRQEVVPSGRLRSSPLEPPAGTGSTEPEPPPQSRLTDEHQTVACTTCFTPIQQRLARVNNGLCNQCKSTTSEDR